MSTKNQETRPLPRPAKIAIAGLIFLSSMVAISATAGSLQGKTIVRHAPVEIKWHQPIEIIPIAEYHRRQEQEKLIEVITDKVIKEITAPAPTATPTKSPEKAQTGLIKPVSAQEWSFERYAKQPHYQAIIEGLKARYQNWEAAAELQAHEGMFDPTIKNPTSGACGLPQALPCAKMKCPLDASGIDCQLDWQKAYITDRYGTVTNALNFWRSRHPINGKDVGNWY